VIYAIILHALAGSLTGTAFKIRTLLLVLGFVVIEFAILTVVQGMAALAWGLACVFAVQLGYVAGIFMRGALEHSGYLLSRPDKRRLF
jgi:hypothetical protein